MHIFFSVKIDFSLRDDANMIVKLFAELRELFDTFIVPHLHPRDVVALSATCIHMRRLYTHYMYVHARTLACVCADVRTLRYRTCRHCIYRRIDSRYTITVTTSTVSTWISRGEHVMAYRFKDLSFRPMTYDMDLSVRRLMPSRYAHRRPAQWCGIYTPGRCIRQTLASVFTLQELWYMQAQLTVMDLMTDRHIFVTVARYVSPHALGHVCRLWRYTVQRTADQKTVCAPGC